MVALTPTLESEVLTNNENYTVVFVEATKTLTITDIHETLVRFFLIKVILNYYYGPI